ncbi:MAG: VOC family protein [Candidatus Krumholzibacteriia bacterium]
MFDRISHIGILVSDMDRALRVWRDGFGLKQFKEAEIPAEGLHSVFLSVSGRPGEMTVELMEPVDPSDMSNPVARRLAKVGEGFYHLAVVVDDVDETAASLSDAGLRIIHRAALEGAAQGRWLVHPKDACGVMVEGVEEWSELPSE